MTMSNDNTPTNLGDWWKVFAAWAANAGASAISSITIQSLVLGLTGVYTLLQIYILWRDKIRGAGDEKADKP